MQKLIAGMALAILWLMTLPTSTSAHHVWLNASRYTLEEAGQGSFGGKTIIYFGWGDFYPLHDFLRQGQLQRFWMINPAGETRELKPGDGGFHATRVRVPTKGTYLVAAALKPTFVSDILEGAKLRVLLKPKDELPKGAQILESKFGLQFAKAILNVGDVDPGDLRFSTTVGQDLEIIPLKNPYHLREGDYLPFKILFKGSPLHRPLADPTIKATYLGFSTGKDVFASTAEVNKQGIAKVKIIRYGVWQIFAIHSHEPPAEIAGKADKVEYKASLTFEVK
ncbi:MAG: DUF4198 domain-containing protein [Candidatus Methylomirabilales bacterium]